MYKVNLYMKYQSAVEILSILASCIYCLKMPLNTIRQQYTTKTSTVTPHFYCNFRPWIFMPSFITNLWQILFPGNHLNPWILKQLKLVNELKRDIFDFWKTGSFSLINQFLLFWYSFANFSVSIRALALTLAQNTHAFTLFLTHPKTVGTSPFSLRY